MLTHEVLRATSDRPIREIAADFQARRSVERTELNRLYRYEVLAERGFLDGEEFQRLLHLLGASDRGVLSELF